MNKQLNRIAAELARIRNENAAVPAAKPAAPAATRHGIAAELDRIQAENAARYSA